MARPTKLTDTIQQTIVDAVRNGLTLDDAAIMANIHPRTCWEWNDQGRKAHEYRGRQDAGVRIRTEERRRLTARDLRCMEFHQAYTAARREYIAAHQLNVERACFEDRVERITETVETVDAAGRVVSRVVNTREVHRGPDRALSLKVLERRAPGWRPGVEVTGAGGEPLVPADVIAGEIMATIAALQANPTGQPEEWARPALPLPRRDSQDRADRALRALPPAGGSGQ